MSKGSRNRSISKAFNDNYSQIKWSGGQSSSKIIDFVVHCVDDHGLDYEFHIKDLDYISALGHAKENSPREDKVLSITWVDNDGESKILKLTEDKSHWVVGKNK